MDEARQRWFAFLCRSTVSLARFLGGLVLINIAVFGLFAAALLLGGSIAFLVGPLVAICLILFIVQSMNRRDDPRHAKRPHDNP